MPLILTLGFKENGRHAEPTVLYAGGSSDEATRILNNPPVGFIHTGVIKNPGLIPNRYFPENTAVPEVTAQSELIEPPPAKPAKK